MQVPRASLAKGPPPTTSVGLVPLAPGRVSLHCLSPLLFAPNPLVGVWRGHYRMGVRLLLEGEAVFAKERLCPQTSANRRNAVLLWLPS